MEKQSPLKQQSATQQPITYQAHPNILTQNKIIHNISSNKQKFIQNKSIQHHFCQFIQAQTPPLPIHRQKHSPSRTNPLYCYNKRTKSIQNIHYNSKKACQNIQKQIKIITNHRRDTAVLRQKIKQNTILQQQMVGRKTCKIYNPGKEQNFKFQSNLQDLNIFKQKQNQQDYNIRSKSKNTKQNTKHNKEIQSKSKKSYFTFQDDSFQNIEDTVPGPGQYNIPQKCKEITKSKNNFSKQKRFINIRPVTALLQYSNYQSPLLKGIKDNNLDHVAFGTSKAIPRSEIRRIQYCEWNRPHFYQSLQISEREKVRKDPTFSSTLSRFRDPIKIYHGPDFYNQQSNIKTNNSELPCHYFISEVPKGLQFPPYDQRDFYDVLMKNEEIKVRRKTRGKQNILKVRGQQDQQQIIQRRKNSGKASMDRIGKRSKIKKQQKHQEKSEQQKIQENKAEKRQKKVKINSRNQFYNYADKWNKPSYNIKFQSRPTLFRQ